MGFGENDDIVHVRVGGNSCSGVSITAKDVELQCVVDPGTGASKDVSVWVAGQETVASGLFRYGVPTVTSIEPTLIESRMFNSSFSETVPFDSFDAVKLKKDHTEIELLVPMGSGTGFTLEFQLPKGAGVDSSFTQTSQNDVA